MGLVGTMISAIFCCKCCKQEEQEPEIEGTDESSNLKNDINYSINEQSENLNDDEENQLHMDTIQPPTNEEYSVESSNTYQAPD